MKKTLFIGAMTALLFIQCDKKNDPFLIEQGYGWKACKRIFKSGK